MISLKKEKKCCLCAKPIYNNLVYCSPSCRRKKRKQKLSLLRPSIHFNGESTEIISPGSLGAAVELIIAADLMFKGFDVFRALSPHGCDLIICGADKKCFLVEVKTGWKNPQGEIRYPKVRKDKFDILAVYLREGTQIAYFPSLDKFRKKDSL